MAKGLFITLEGIEGSGKTTQARLLEAALRQAGYPIFLFREPGGTVLGEEVRRLLLHPEGEGKEMESRTELLLFQASRCELVNKRIRPALAEGRVVVGDRFADATRAYQGYGRGIPLAEVEAALHLACGALQPDLTILFDVPAEEGLRRCLAREGKEFGGADRLESVGVEFLQRVRAGYLNLAQAEPERIRVVEVTGSVSNTFEDLARALKEKFELDLAWPTTTNVDR